MKRRETDDFPVMQECLHSLTDESSDPPSAEADPRIRSTFNMLADLDLAQQWTRPPSQLLLRRPWRGYVESALRAEHIMKRDVHYVVREGKVLIVDEYTGRIFSEREWRDGLHQAVEAKEGVSITEEKRTLARISRQRYFQRYKMLCGMTGTASGHQRELVSCYGLPIVVIPLRKPSRRIELLPRYFSSEAAKIEAVIADVKQRTRAGRPVLIGTRTIDQSIRLSQRLFEEGIHHEVLNGVQDAEEASLIAIAGHRKGVTVATNMAGRGTDIKLTSAVVEAGGLHVIGFERNFSRRIDRQLLGRAGRQGDPGSGQFYISADDEILKRFGPGLSRILRQLDHGQEGQSNARLDQRIRKIQDLAERESYRARRLVMREELWLDKVRKTVS
jgi:preprotein translocase subunit SecA